MPVFPTTARPGLSLAALAGTLLIATSTASIAAGPPELGLWYDDSGRGAVEIAPCGDKVCGHIVWLENNRGSDGKPLHDRYNPDAGMRGRPICGIQVIGNLSPQSDGTLGAGWIYDPKVGKSYDVKINVSRPNMLHVYGYAGLELLGKSLYWKRAPDNLPRCSSNR